MSVKLRNYMLNGMSSKPGAEAFCPWKDPRPPLTTCRPPVPVAHSSRFLELKEVRLGSQEGVEMRGDGSREF